MPSQVAPAAVTERNKYSLVCVICLLSVGSGCPTYNSIVVKWRVVRGSVHGVLVALKGEPSGYLIYGPLPFGVGLKLTVCSSEVLGQNTW